VSTNLTSINIDSASKLFTGGRPAILDGSFDNFDAGNIFKATFGSEFGDSSFGPVLPVGLTPDELVADLTVVGSLAGGGALGDVDLGCMPEPSSHLLALLGIIGLLRWRRRR
jgi:MYXO-CTERM domain-containing protein